MVLSLAWPVAGPMLYFPVEDTQLKVSVLLPSLCNRQSWLHALVSLTH